MRISSSMMMDNYAKSLESKYNSINKYSNQVSTTRAFDSASDDPVAAMQTIKACHEYTNNQQYQSNVQQASSWVSATESAVKEINSVLTTAQEKVTEAVNGTNSTSDLQNYAVAFTNYRNEIVTALNSTYSGQYIFGESTSGTTDSSGSATSYAPFKLDDSGNLQAYDYSAAGYTAVSGITSADMDSMKLTMPIDVGLGMSYSDGTNVDKGSVFDASTSGLDAIISDTTNGGNIVDQLTAAINAIGDSTTDSTTDMTALSSLLTNVQSAQNAVLKVNVDVGEKSSMLTTIAQRLTDNETNITSNLANSMECDATKAIMKYNTSETVYKESLSMASSVLQTSLFDFLK